MLNDLLDMEEEGESASALQDTAPGLLPPREAQDCLEHQTVETALLDAVNKGSLPHALIFSGPKGIGKATMAFRLVRFLLKNGVPDRAQDSLFGDAPAEVSSLSVLPDDPVFRQVASGGHPDLMTVERQDGKTSVDVESIRKVPPFLRMTASQGGWRVVMIDDADTMNRNAQNAILKILEEPPDNTVLILVTHRIGTLIPTIRSRCRVIPFQPLSDDAVIELLRRQDPALPQDDCTLLARFGDGSVHAALQLLEEGGMEAVQNTLNLLSGWPEWDWPRIHQNADLLGRSKADRNAYGGFRDILIWMFESLVQAKARGQALPEPFTIEALNRMLSHYSLEQLSQICENLKDHFEQFDRANLDKRQAVLGAFSLIDG